MKRIVLCFDGTWNKPDPEGVAENERANTNVCLFHESVAPVDDNGVSQQSWYNAGVGSAAWDRIAGGAFGAGLDLHILAGYRYLVEKYDDGDEVYVLGFSRGAYSARSLVGMIRNSGLVKRKLGPIPLGKGAIESLIVAAYSLYRTRDNHPNSESAGQVRNLIGREIPIHFLGVWDTVGALGIPLDVAKEINATFYEFHDTELSGIVKYAYHALAIDEHRKIFEPTLWAPTAKVSQQTMEQRWFVGAHSNVGGGYADQLLSAVPLQWMQQKAKDAGLKVKLADVAETHYAGPIADSYGDFVKKFPMYKEPRFYRPLLQTSFGNEVIDDSVDRRRRATGNSRYAPTNSGLSALVG